MLASPIAFGGASASRYGLVLVGTNVICGSSLSAAAIELGEKSSVTVSGEGRLEAAGMDGQAGIGLSRGADGSSAALTVTSGEIVATGGATAAGIGERSAEVAGKNVSVGTVMSVRRSIPSSRGVMRPVHCSSPSMASGALPGQIGMSMNEFIVGS